MKHRGERIETIFKNFHAIKRGYSHGSRFSHRRFGVTITQASALLLLVHEGRKTMGEVAETLGISKGAATQLLDSLIEKGFVERVQDSTDRRVAYVSMTRKGMQHFKRVQRSGAKHVMGVFDLLNDTELEQIETITTKLAERVREIQK